MAKLKLTEQQQAAVENRGGSLLVSAACVYGIKKERHGRKDKNDSQ